MELPDNVQRAMHKGEAFVVPPDMRMDTSRGYDAVHPPLKILTWRGKHAEFGWKDEPELRPRWDAFMRQIELHESKTDEPEIPIEKTICFEQDGFSFDAQGLIVREVMQLVDVMRARKRIAQSEAVRIGQEAARKAMVEAGFSDTSHFAPMVALPDNPAGAPSPTDVIARARDGHHHPNLDRPHAGTPAENVDLSAWARGEKKAMWWAVKKAFREQHSMDVKDAAHARQWLMEQGMIPAIA